MSIINLLSDLHPSYSLSKSMGSWSALVGKESQLNDLFADVVIEANQFNAEEYGDLIKLGKACNQLENRFYYEIPRNKFIPLSCQQTLYPQYCKALDSLLDATAKTFAGKLPELLNIYWDNENKIDELIKNLSSGGLSFEKRKWIKSYLEKVIPFAIQKIKTNGNAQGFVYRIKNKQDVYCYFVGTIHLTTASNCRAPLVQEVCAKSKRFYFEINNRLNWSSSFLIETFFNKLTYFNTAMDYAIYLKAKEKNAEVKNLETVTQVIFGSSGAICENHRFYPLDANFKQTMNHTKDSLNFKKLLERHKLREGNDSVYQTGRSYFFAAKDMIVNFLSANYYHYLLDTEQLQEGKPRLCLFSKSILDTRHKEWEKVIIPEIQSTTESVCFAFGFSHLHDGNIPILKIVQEANFPIEKGFYDASIGQISWSSFTI